ncbi:hypothetical protein GCM10023169_33560 [Georgenia halophila]|uniref:Hyaluronate lyase n=1 Tax=Georgenia halophila TaxID=620889 RepID=A0ABP8LIE8_9MICO
MELTRRSVLSMIPAAGLLTVGMPMRALAAAETAEGSRILANTVGMLAGTAESNTRLQVAEKIDAIQDAARDRLAAMETAGDGELFAGLPLGSDEANLQRSFQYLAQIALATRTPGTDSDLVDDAATQGLVVDALAWLHEHHLADQGAGYYGNWYAWEIGIPTHATRTLALLAGTSEEPAADLVADYVATLDAYLRNGVDGDVDLDSRFHTGANLADITTNRILQGALLDDDARITKAIADQATVYDTIDPYHLDHGVTDGYYADGSFIQHHSVAYTGSYGRVLLGRIVQTVTMLDGATTGGGDLTDLVAVVTGWVENGFAPLIVEGWMMEVVKGRAVSRQRTGYADVRAVVEAIVDLSAYTDPDAARALQGYVKHIRTSSPESLEPEAFASPLSIARYADIVADGSIEEADLNPPARSVAFNAMDRTVHRRPGYAFALARSSERISRYEYMSGENLVPWFQGDGAHYLYLTGQNQTRAFGVDHYTTVSPYRLAGVTAPVEERRTVPELYGQDWYENPDHPLGFTSSSESQNTYVYFPRGTNQISGGATLGAYGAAAMVLSDDAAYVDKQAGILPDDFVVYQNARGTKSWFLLDDEIVVLAAGIEGGSGRAAVTTIDSRISAPSDGVRLTGAGRDGAAWAGTGTGRLAWLRWENRTDEVAVGYVLLDDQEVEVGLERVTRSRRVIRSRNPDTDVTKDVFGLTVEHPADRGPASLAYALVPHADEQQLSAYPGALSVLANTPQLQAVKHARLGLVALNAFAGGPHQAERLVVDGPASVLTRARGRDREIAISDPTMERDTVTVTVRGRPLELESADGAVTIRRVPGGTEITADTRQAYGRTVTATLR